MNEEDGYGNAEKITGKCTRKAQLLAAGKRLVQHEGRTAPRHFPRQKISEQESSAQQPGKKEWKRMVGQMEKLGILTEIDMAAFAGYCQAYARWKEAEEFISQHGTIVKTPSGYWQQVPQVSIVFDVAVDMVEQCPALKKRIKPVMSVKRLVYKPANSFYQVLSAEAYTKYGLNVHAVIFDELHSQPNRELFDVMTKGSGDARTQPLFFLMDQV